MTDKEIYQQIEEHSEEANALYERIHEQVEASIVKHAQTKKRRKKLWTSILSIAAVVVVTLAIVLPIVLQPQDEIKRYADAQALSREVLDYNLKEYGAKNNQSLLYFNWYEDAENLLTARYYEEGKEKDTVFISETITDGNSGRTVQLSVMKWNIIVESFDNRFEEIKTTIVDNTQIIYILNKDSSFAKFEYQGYKYYLDFDEGVTLEFLVQTIESMFNN